MQEIIVATIVAACLIITARQFVRFLRGKGTECGCAGSSKCAGCTGCALKLKAENRLGK